MKTIDLLLISFIVLLFACNNNNNHKKKKSNEIIDSDINLIDTTALIDKKTSNNTFVVDSINIDTIKKKKIVRKNPKMKVVINGKVYYKINVRDHRYKKTYTFFNVLNNSYYDVRTGKHVIIPKGEPSN